LPPKRSDPRRYYCTDELSTQNRYRFDYDRCTGCGVCAEQCPVHAIEMVPESDR
jgi:Pyruvate/2-oxoacid:ferredoxin oxidoreductase delta subunit